MKNHGEHRFQIVFIVRIDKMRTDHSFGNRSPIQLYILMKLLYIYYTFFSLPAGQPGDNDIPKFKLTPI